MLNTFSKAISLGIGMMVAGKEQIEKTVEELVQKGEVNRTESRKLVDELVQKGRDLREEIGEMVKENVNAMRGEVPASVRSEIERLEKRIAELERIVRPANE